MGHLCNSCTCKMESQVIPLEEDKLIIVVSLTRPMFSRKSIKQLLQDDIMQ